MIKKFQFGKVDGYGNGRKSCTVEVEFGFQEFAGQEPYFSVCGDLWNHSHTEVIEGGQCLKELLRFSEIATNELYLKIFKLWKEWHLKPISIIPQDVQDRINTILDLKEEQKC